MARGSQALPIAPPVHDDVMIDIDLTPTPTPVPRVEAEPPLADARPSQRVAQPPRLAQEWPVVALAYEQPVGPQHGRCDSALAIETELVAPVELDTPRSSLRWSVLAVLAIAVAAGAFVATRGVAVAPVTHQRVEAVPAAGEPVRTIPVVPTTAASAVASEPAWTPAAAAEPTATPAADPTEPPAAPPPPHEAPNAPDVVEGTSPPATETSMSSPKPERSNPRKRASARTRVAAAPAVAPAAAARGPHGTLMVSSKPPCEIVIDGVATVLVTPQRAMKLAPGKHKITLFNDTYKIKATIDIVIEPGKTTKLIKDFTAQMRRR
jgi:hypothetical protein